MQVDLLIEEPKWQAFDLSGLAERAFEAVLAELSLSRGFEVSLLACDDDRIVGLNSEFRDKAGATNVLSWPSVDLAAETEGEMPDIAQADEELGDVAMAYQTCASEAAEQGKTLTDHVTHLLVHGYLHLFGFDHIRDKDAALMESFESRILAKLGIGDPYEI